jgi:hypothetical protein
MKEGPRVDTDYVDFPIRASDCHGDLDVGQGGETILPQLRSAAERNMVGKPVRVCGSEAFTHRQSVE